MAQLSSSTVLGNLAVTKKTKTRELELVESTITLDSEKLLALDCNGVMRKAQTIANISNSSMDIVSAADASSVVFSKVATGHYRISNINSFATDEWGVSIPRDDYDIPTLVVETSTGGGVLNIYVYEPILKIGLPSISKGHPIDIPSGSKITVNLGV